MHFSTSRTSLKRRRTPRSSIPLRRPPAQRMVRIVTAAVDAVADATAIAATATAIQRSRGKRRSRSLPRLRTTKRLMATRHPQTARPRLRALHARRAANAGAGAEDAAGGAAIALASPSRRAQRRPVLKLSLKAARTSLLKTIPPSSAPPPRPPLRRWRGRRVASSAANVPATVAAIEVTISARDAKAAASSRAARASAIPDTDRTPPGALRVDSSRAATAMAQAMDLPGRLPSRAPTMRRPPVTKSSSFPANRWPATAAGRNRRSLGRPRLQHPPALRRRSRGRHRLRRPRLSTRWPRAGTAATCCPARPSGPVAHRPAPRNPAAPSAAQIAVPTAAAARVATAMAAAKIASVVTIAARRVPISSPHPV